MKRVSYSILLILLLSCARTPRRVGTVSVFFKDQTVKDCSLLFVRDSSIVVREYTYISDTTSGRANYSIPFSKIAFVGVGMNENIAPALFGFGFGGFVGYWVAYGIHKATGGYDGPYSGFSYAIPGCSVGAPLGSFLACEFHKQKSSYYPDDIDDLQYLKNVSVYPTEEPDELKKIK